MERAMWKRAAAAALLAACLLLGACANAGGAGEPRQRGYDCRVVYDALGGTINLLERRETYYNPGSCLYEPKGSANMLVMPVRAGYMLAGWYSAVQESADADGNTFYSFLAEDRWDFAFDRVEGDLTLYARWIPFGTADYVDAATGEVLFSKRIAEDSPVSPLSNAVLSMFMPAGSSMLGYYADAACTEPYEFVQGAVSALLPAEREVYETIAAAHPDALRLLDAREAYEPKAGETLLYLSGFQAVLSGADAAALVRRERSAMFEAAVADYEAAAASQRIYIRFGAAGDA